MRILRNDAINCHYCKFVVDALEASPWVTVEEDDYIAVAPQLVGSQHTSPYLRKWLDWAKCVYGETLRHVDCTTEYESYYRPKVRVIKKGSDWDQVGYRNEPSYAVRSSLFLFPLMSTEELAVDKSERSQTFCGRRVGARVEFELIKVWFSTCVHQHQKDAISYRSDFPYHTYFDGLKSNEHGCRPDSSVEVPGFRLIDISRRCITQARTPCQYAALSYVWGDAQRLKLDKENESWLMTPGSLSGDSEQIPRTFRDALVVAESLSIPYLWIDALCIHQDDGDQMRQQMDAMDLIYGAATLTIVSDTTGVDTGIFGISKSRSPAQAIFRHGSLSYVSMKKTFGDALQNSPWERRAWCLQEKIFSKRLLIFTETQAFFHCSAATWFEDTILEQKEEVYISGAVQMRERPLVTRKLQPPKGNSFTAYEKHQSAFERGFWPLVSIYSQRDLAFHSDALRAFGGILRSVDALHGHAIWGIPQYEFVRGLTWVPARHQLSLRREGFPSWSWVGWSANQGNTLRFGNCKRNDADNRFSNGIYYVRKEKPLGSSVWDIQWYYHSCGKPGNAYSLTQIEKHPKPHTPQSTQTENLVLPDCTHWIARRSHQRQPNRVRTNAYDVLQGHHTWRLFAHPQRASGQPAALEAMPSLLDQAANWLFGEKTRFPDLPQKPHMPPLSHVLRFYTSVATLLIEADSTNASSVGLWPRRFKPSRFPGESDAPLHRALVPGTDTLIGYVQLDPEWSGAGQEHTVIYISRWCNDMCMDEYDVPGYVEAPEQLNLLLIEDVEGWGEVKQRVQMLELVDIVTWRKARPRWKLVNLA